MNLKKVITVVLLTLSVTGVSLFGQSQGQNTREKERTIEDLYLSQNIELQLIRNQALSNDWELKLLALQNLRSMAGDGRISNENPGAFVVLETLAKQEPGPNIKNFNLVRKEACNILGEIGGERAQKILLEVMMMDQEPMVLAEAVYALGKIGSDKKGEVISRLMWVLHKENVKATPDNNFAFATLLSIERIGKSEDGIKNPETLNVLIEILEANYIRDVKLKAIDVIYKLRR
jgi:HEAT repeat protein